MAEKALKLEIVTPKSQVVSQEVEIVTVPGGEGEFGVLPGHTPFLTTVRPGRLVYEAGGKRETLAVGWGYAEVGPSRVLILTEMARRPSEIDRDTVRREYDDLSQRLKGDVSPEEREAISRQMERVKAQLKALEAA
jgi:F-type H+-transporting ATPase subunit epsilon